MLALVSLLLVALSAGGTVRRYKDMAFPYSMHCLLGPDTTRICTHNDTLRAPPEGLQLTASVRATDATVACQLFCDSRWTPIHFGTACPLQPNTIWPISCWCPSVVRPTSVTVVLDVFA
jgi:hypothetical protein